MELQTNVKTGDLKISSPENSASTVVTPVNQVIGAKEPDLITRVSQFKKEDIKTPEDNKPTGDKVIEPEFDFKEIDKIQDPVAKEYAEKAYKSFQRGFNQKFQEIAELRKSLEAEKTKAESSSNWTPERIQKELLSNPNFVQAAQQVAQIQNPADSGLTDQEYSALNETEKKQLQAMQNELTQLKQQNFVQHLRQQDEQLKIKYANYKPDAVDIITNDLLTGKIQASREDLWKVYDYEQAMQRAYELGKQDRVSDNQEKLNAMSIEGVSAKGNNELPKAEPNESAMSYFRKLAMNNISRMQGQKK